MRRAGVPVRKDAPLCDFIVPLGTKGAAMIGSTDVGDVSWVVPTVQARVATHAIGTPGHSWQITAQGKSGQAKKGMVHAAKVMAGVAVDALRRPNADRACQGGPQGAHGAYALRLSPTGGCSSAPATEPEGLARACTTIGAGGSPHSGLLSLTTDLGMAPIGVLGRWGIVRPRHVEQGNVKSDFRFGIEEEFFVVCEDTQLLEPPAHEAFLARAKELSRRSVHREILQSQVEAATPVCNTFAEARRYLCAARARHWRSRSGNGLAVISAGTHPTAHWPLQQQTDKTRYDAVMASCRSWGLSNLVCGMHVHVEVPDEICAWTSCAGRSRSCRFCWRSPARHPSGAA